MIFQNYHRHSSYSNVLVPDCVVNNESYAKRASELGHGIISGVEHGWAGRYIEGYDLSKKYNLKFLFGLEAYFVKNRLEKDRTNAHIILLAKNENGRKAINNIVSEANISGYYYRARVDLPLLHSLPENDVWITTSCVGGILNKYDDGEKIALDLFDKFRFNFFLEMQYHNTNSQKATNEKALNISNKNGIRIMMGCDSHMIYQEQSKDRDDFLASKKVFYEDEVGWYMDYPDGETAYSRFLEQGVLPKNKIKECMDNTNILLDVEEYTSPIFNKEIKMPSIYTNKTQKEKDDIFKKLVWSNWEKEKQYVEKEKWQMYEEEINKEIDIVITTKHSDYFLLDNAIIAKGKELGGVITQSGRGSAVSFYINKLLGFTEVDRISSKVKMYPERFMSSTRIIESKSLADFDMNLANPEVFAKAQKEVLGEESSYPMIAYGTLKPKAAFKMYARAKNIDFETANNVTSQIEQYENAIKHLGEDEKDSLSITDFIDKKYETLFLESEKYLGIIENIKIHPCSYLLYENNIREEIGLIKINSANGDEHLCTIMDGLWAENYKFLKNDLLKVSVVDLIFKVYERIGISPHSTSELLKITDGDEKTWNIYKNGWTMGINQVEQPATKSKATKYCPKNISELSALVAAVRPGFASMYKKFESREPFSYGIPTFDKIIQTEDMKSSFLLYQEMSMAALSYAGVPLTECYEIIKNIAKKRPEKVLKYKEKFLEGFSSKIIEDEGESSRNAAPELSNKVWKIISDSVSYSFNASHSYCVALDSLYGAYLKSHYPLEFYEVFLNMLEKDGDKDRLSDVKIEARDAFHISFPKYKFGQDNRSIVFDKNKNEITSSLSSIKGFGKGAGNGLYELGKENFEDFLDLLVFAEENGYNNSKFSNLIKINYFEKFGNNKKLDVFYDEFSNGKYRFLKSLSDASKTKRILELKNIFDNIPNDRYPISDQVKMEKAILGYVQATYPVDKKYVFVNDIDTKFSPRANLYCLATGKTDSIKIQKRLFELKKFKDGDILYVNKFSKKPAVKYVNGKYVEDDSSYQWWIESYEIIENENFDLNLS